MILSDQGRDTESLEWYRQARAIFESQPSPNFRNIIEELGHEAAALVRLGRAGEAEAVEKQIAAVRKTAAEIPACNEANGSEMTLPEGALFIELDCGLRFNSATSEFTRLGARLSAILDEGNLGRWHGLIRIPESATLIFYGSDAEAMYSAIQPELAADKICDAAQITIRQGARERQVVGGRRVVN